MRSNLIGTDFVLIGLIVLVLSDCHVISGQTATVSSPESRTLVEPAVDSSPTSAQQQSRAATQLNNLTLSGEQESSGELNQTDRWPVRVIEADQRQESDRSVESAADIWSKIRHLHQKVRLKEPDNTQQKLDDLHENESQERDYVEDSTKSPSTSSDGQTENGPPGLYAKTLTKSNAPVSGTNSTTTLQVRRPKGNSSSGSSTPSALARPFRILASGSRKSKLLGVANGSPPAANMVASQTPDNTLIKNIDQLEPPVELIRKTDPTTGRGQEFSRPTTGAPNLLNRFVTTSVSNEARMKLTDTEGAGDPSGATAPESADSLELYDTTNGETDSTDANSLDDPSTYDQNNKPNLDIVTKFLRIVESQSLMGENCTAGTDFNLGEGVVDRYAQERFRLEAEVAVNRANWLTRMWKSGDKGVLHSEYLLHVNLYSIIEMDEDIFAAGNCYDK